MMAYSFMAQSYSRLTSILVSRSLLNLQSVDKRITEPTIASCFGDLSVLHFQAGTTGSGVNVEENVEDEMPR